MIEEFISDFWNSCKCSRACHTKVSIKTCLETYEDYSGLSDEEKRVRVGSLIKNMDITGVSNDPRTTGVKKVYQWSLNGQKVCKPFFMFVHSSSRAEVARLEDCHKKEKDFGNKKKGNNLLSYSVYDQLYTFLKAYFELHVQPNPEGPDKHLLPSSFSLREVYSKFCTEYKKVHDLDKDPLCWKTFYTYYKTRFPYYKQLNKKTDFCDQCCRLKQAIVDRKSTQENKDQAKINLEEHRKLYTEARQTYTEHRKKTAFEDGWIVISLDYAENLFVPHLPVQPGAFYFHTRRKVELFGITNEATNIQANFLIDEPFRVKKGPNSVISMLDYYIRTFISPGSNLIIYCDNCGGQNKNQYLIGYLAYIVKVLKILKRVELYFLVVGHTKFAPDSHFGTIKNLFKRSTCESIIDLVGNEGIICKSAKNNFEIPYKDPITKEKNFEFYDWRSFIGSYFNECSGIRSWHVVKIPDITENILVADHVTAPLREYKITNNHGDISSVPLAINPDLLCESRLKELKFFNQYINSSHHQFISENY